MVMMLTGGVISERVVQLASYRVTVPKRAQSPARHGSENYSQRDHLIRREKPEVQFEESESELRGNQAITCRDPRIALPLYHYQEAVAEQTHYDDIQTRSQSAEVKVERSKEGVDIRCGRGR